MLQPQYRGIETRVARTDVLVVCNDDGLLIELGPLFEDRYRIHTVDTLASLGGQVNSSRWIGIIDVDSQAGARSALARLEGQYPGCPFIVVTARPADWSESIARGTVLSALGRDQLTAARLHAVLQVAEDRLRADGLGAPDASSRGADPGRLGMSSRRRGILLAGGAALMVMLGVSAAWLRQRSALPAASRTLPGASSISIPLHAATSPEAASSSSSPQPQVLELLSQARVAFRDQKQLPPPEGGLHGDSALELYVQVLRQDPQDDEARAGVRRLLVIGRDRIMADTASGQLDDANRLLDLFKAADVGAGDLQPLASAVSVARPQWLALRAQQSIAAGDLATAEQLLAQATADGADAATVKALRNREAAKKLQQQLLAMAGRVDDAIQAGTLLPPAMNNALSRLAAMRSMARNDPLTLEAQDEVQTALVEAGERATRAALFAVAQSDLNAAAELGSFAPLNYARQQLQQAQAAVRPARAAVAAVPQARQTAARMPDLAGDASASAPSAPSAPLPYIAAQPTRALRLSYPPDATASGSMIVEFTLSAKGSASDVTVVHSDLPRSFDRDAIRAVRRGRYSTRELPDGRAVRARIKLTFNTG